MEGGKGVREAHIVPVELQKLDPAAQPSAPLFYLLQHPLGRDWRLDRSEHAPFGRGVDAVSDFRG